MCKNNCCKKEGDSDALLLLVSRSVVSDSLRPHRLQHARPPGPSPAPGAHSNACPSSRWCHPTISSSVVPFSSCPQSFPASGSFLMSKLCTSGGQSIGVSASASVHLMNSQGWFSFRWTDTCYNTDETWRHWANWNTLSGLKQASHEKENDVWFHLPWVSSMTKFLETESRELSQGLRGRRVGTGRCYMSVGLQFCKKKKFWTLVPQHWIYLTLLNNMIRKG